MTYSQGEGAAEGLTLFRCEAFRCSMTPTSCGKRWRKAQIGEAKSGAIVYGAASTHSLTPSSPRTRCARVSQGALDGMADRERNHVRAQEADALERCRSCPIGAAHAGQVHVAYSSFFGASVCPRCRQGAMRIIDGKRCVSCYNREREMKAGKNARGNAPARLKALAPVELRVVVNGQARRHTATAVDAFEPTLQVMRTTKGALAFGPAFPLPRRRQLDLFDEGMGLTAPRRPKGARQAPPPAEPVQTRIRIAA